MPTIKAHFDGRVFVPDEPVELQLGQEVFVQPAARAGPVQAPVADVSYLRKLDLDLNPELLREIIDGPELGLENF